MGWTDSGSDQTTAGSRRVWTGSGLHGCSWQFRYEKGFKATNTSLEVVLLLYFERSADFLWLSQQEEKLQWGQKSSWWRWWRSAPQSMWQTAAVFGVKGHITSRPEQKNLNVSNAARHLTDALISLAADITCFNDADLEFLSSFLILTSCETIYLFLSQSRSDWWNSSCISHFSGSMCATADAVKCVCAVTIWPRTLWNSPWWGAVCVLLSDLTPQTQMWNQASCVVSELPKEAQLELDLVWESKWSRRD